MSNNAEGVYTVQEAADRSGLSAHTLRYYERAGLLKPILRKENSGHRRYSEEDLRLVEFLKRMRCTGMPIHQLQRYVSLLLGGDDTLEERRIMLEEHRAAVCERITELEGHLQALEYKIANYQGLVLKDRSESDVCLQKE
jgi:DNA-binding transcriptional MerR regulator